MENSDDSKSCKAESKHPPDESYFEPIIRSDSSYTDRHADDGPMERAELQRLALVSRKTSTTWATTPGSVEKQSTLQRVGTGHPALDPSSPEFDTRAWVRWMLAKSEQAGVKQKPHGTAFRRLTISGFGPEMRYLKTVISPVMQLLRLGKAFGKKREKKIITDVHGTVKDGEMLLVLGRPGSGCSTFLKGISGEIGGLKLSEDSKIHYSGVSQDEMRKHYKGDIAYNQETDKHFPNLTVRQTLYFAAKVKSPAVRFNNVSRAEWADELTRVVSAAFGLSGVQDTMVGNDWIRGVSGGQRKRVSLAEMALAGATLGCWDNSTRGLDSATALDFIKSLRLSCDVTESSHVVAIYQASQAIYDLFDKVTLLYEGRQVFFGPGDAAKQFFENMGWYCPPRQTTADFLTSVTNPGERIAMQGRETQVPQTAEEFEKYWQQSDAYKTNIADIDRHEEDYPVGGSGGDAQQEAHRVLQSKHSRPGSPYVLSIVGQLQTCVLRSYQRTVNDSSAIISSIVGQVVMALIIGSIYYGTPEATSSLFSKAAVLFLGILFNALLAVNEIQGLYEQRPIVAKQAGYAFYHPFVEAFAGIVVDVPIKFVGAVFFNIVLYFLSGLRMEASRFFIYFLFVFAAQQAMTMIFRTMAAITKSIAQALAISGILVLAISLYTGFSIPRPFMHPWFQWISYINPVFYAFEALLTNEVHGFDYPCGNTVVPYPHPSNSNSFVCPVVGAVAGHTTVSGDAWVKQSYGYSYSHIWRNFGIILAFLIFFMATYLLGMELNSTNLSSTAGVLVYKRMKGDSKVDEGKSSANGTNTDLTRHQDQHESLKDGGKGSDTFNWASISYGIPVKGTSEPRRLLNNVSGWVAPGTLTALMGTSGAGKTTLLDVLAQRTSIGVVTGDRRIDGNPLDASFQRRTGYVQQNDLHLSTTTVREALRFSAALRQPQSTPLEEKYAYVEEIISTLGMESYGEALVGDSDLGEGLNVEQRKMLSIGVELVAKPTLLIFLDEPTSGLDSQSANSIIRLLRRLANEGQAILATIHQPSAVLFQEFDRLLFLASGGRTVYFGDLGQNSRTLLDYFESEGARKCDDHENPAEYMLEVVATNPTGHDWHQVWKDSSLKRAVDEELARKHVIGGQTNTVESDKGSSGEFATPFGNQLRLVTARVFQQYWRSPTYIWSKATLATLSSLFIGFTFFQSPPSQQGLQNIILSVFSVQTIFSPLIQQIMPRFVTQRTLYEARERPSKMYSWLAFVLAQIAAEIPYQMVLGILTFAGYYYTVFGIQSSERQGLILLFCIENFVFASTFGQMVVAALPDAEAAGSLATLMTTMSLIFNGVMQPPSSLPKFWIFMFRVSPFTYMVAGLVATGLHGRQIQCTPEEVSVLDPPSGQTCDEYLSSYLTEAPGKLLNPDSVTGCEYCPIRSADQALATSLVFWSDRWRNFGIVLVYIGFNIMATLALYWLFRVRKLRTKDENRWTKRLRAFFVRNADEDKKGREAKSIKIF